MRPVGRCHERRKPSFLLYSLHQKWNLHRQTVCSIASWQVTTNRDSIHTLLISVSITQKSRHSLAAIQVLTSAALSSEAQLGKDMLQAHSVCWQSSSLWSSKAEIIVSSLATHQVPLSASRAHPVFPPCCPFLKPSHYMVDYFWKANKSLLSVFNQLRELHIVRCNHRSDIQMSFWMAQW